MVCKRDWCVVRGGGSPMTRTGPADVAMSACGRASASRPVLVRPGFRELVSVWPLSLGPTVFRAVFPGSAFLKPASCRLKPASRRLKPASCRLAVRSRRPQSSPPMPPNRRPVRAPGLPRPPRPRSSPLAHPLYWYLPACPGPALPGSSFDPGRDMLCILTSPPRWLQWP